MKNKILAQVRFWLIYILTVECIVLGAFVLDAIVRLCR